MKAIAVFPSQHQVTIIDRDEPQVERPAQAKVRILEVGICGTDRELVTFQYGEPPAGSEYLVIGHESLAEVAEIGSDVQHLRRGELVVLTVRRPCPHPECIACRSGRQDFCYTGDFQERGIKGIHGYMAEFVVDEAKNMVPVPQELRDIGVLIEPLTIAEKAMTQVAQVQQRLPWGLPQKGGANSGYRHKAVVLGSGPVGLLGAMKLAISGFTTYVYSRESGASPRASFVKAIGATYLSSQTVPPQNVREQLGNIDLVYEATGASRFAFEVMEVLGTNGVFIFTGVPGRKGPIEFDTDLIMRNLVLKNQVVFGTVNANRGAFEAAIRDLVTFRSRWPEAVKSLITGRYPLEQYNNVLLGQPGGIKNVIAVGGRLPG